MKKVLVTGVSRGIGRSIAERYLREDYELWGTFNASENQARELENTFGEKRVHLLGPYDFSYIDQTESLLEVLKGCKFDSVISNAGMFSEIDDFNDFSLSEYMKIMNCNLMSPTMLLIGLRDSIQSGGNITIISSIDAYSGAYGSISYSVSKASLISLGRCLTVNYGLKNIRVNTIVPGVIDTDMNTLENCMIANILTPMQRVGRPDDIAEMVYFLSSDKASYISGAVIPVDGGYLNTDILLKREKDRDFSNLLFNYANKVVQNHFDSIL